jgi:hypothetical protein
VGKKIYKFIIDYLFGHFVNNLGEIKNKRPQNLYVDDSLNCLYYFLILHQHYMTHGVTTNQSALTKFAGTLSAGALASFVTQPFEVLKTNMIASSSTYIREIHNSIIKNGWSQYMRGGSIAVIRQAYGFSIYTNLITLFNNKIESDIPLMNKFLKYSMSAVTAKYCAMIF